VLVVCACAWAQQAVTVDQLRSFVRSSVKMRMPDKDVASYLSKVRLTEYLDQQTVEKLQSEGAGPKTIAALDALSMASASLPKPKPKQPKPVYQPPPPPPPEEQQAVISEIREYALNYSKSLPDFICTQVTRKYVGATGQQDFHPVGTVVEHLTYFEQKEHYKVTMVNDKVVDVVSHEAVGGASSAGDFGSMLKVTLWPKAEAMIEFDRWATLRGNLCYVFSYRIASGNSDYTVQFGPSGRIVVGYRGLIYVDKKTHVILRLSVEATDIPASFPVQEASERLDYGYQNLSGQQFLLPLKAQVFLRHDRERSRNDIEFRLYQKYSAEASIKFETEVPAPLPDDQNKEEPAQPQGEGPKK
jgi:hypothetical protein